MPWAASQKNAWVAPAAVAEEPTIWPSRLRPAAELEDPPKVPKSVRPYCCAWPKPQQSDNAAKARHALAAIGTLAQFLMAGFAEAATTRKGSCDRLWVLIRERLARNLTDLKPYVKPAAPASL